MSRKEITHKDSMRNLGSGMSSTKSISQGMPPRTPESATPMVKGTQKETKIGIIKSAVKAKIPQSTPSQERRPVGEITKPDYWKDLPATRNRMMINRGVGGKGGPGGIEDPTPNQASDIFNTGASIQTNGYNMGKTVGQDFGTNTSMQSPDLNPGNLPQNIRQNQTPSNPDLSPAPQPKTSAPKSFTPGPSRVKGQGVSNSIVKKMLQKINSKKSN